MYEPGDYPRMMLCLAIVHRRDAERYRLVADMFHEKQARVHDSCADRILDTLAELWMKPVHEFWHDVTDAAAGGVNAYEQAGRLLICLRNRWEE